MIGLSIIGQQASHIGTISKKNGHRLVPGVKYGLKTPLMGIFGLEFDANVYGGLFWWFKSGKELGTSLYSSSYAVETSCNSESQRSTSSTNTGKSAR